MEQLTHANYLLSLVTMATSNYHPWGQSLCTDLGIWKHLACLPEKESNNQSHNEEFGLGILFTVQWIKTDSLLSFSVGCSY